MESSNGGGHDGFALLEARHIDTLTDVIRLLSRTVTKLDETIQKQTAVLIENARVTSFDTATMKRIEDVESAIAALPTKRRKPRRK